MYAFNKATVIDEAVQSTTVPFRVGKLGFGKVPTLRTGKIAVSMELSEDAPDLFAGTVGLVENLFAQRFALDLAHSERLTCSRGCLPFRT